VTGSPDSTVILWNLQSKKPQTNFKAYNNKVYKNLFQRFIMLNSVKINNN
jgi:hypothetical protein